MICQETVLQLGQILEGNEMTGGSVRSTTGRSTKTPIFRLRNTACEGLLGDSRSPRFGPVPLAQCGNTAGVRQQLEVQALGEIGPSTELGKLYPLGEKLCGRSESSPEHSRIISAQAPADVSLVERLNIAKYTTANSGFGRDFFPFGLVEQLVTPQIVIKEITSGHNLVEKSLTSLEVTEYAQRVCREGGKSLCRIFAILCLLQQPREIIHFVDEEISDGDLPLKTMIDPASSKSTNSLNLQHPRSGKPLCSLRAFNHEQFEEVQWTMIPVSFPKDAQYCRFDKRQSLPWSEEWYFNEQYRSYAYISRVRIHDGHHSFKHPYLINGLLALETFTSYRDSHLLLDSEAEDSTPCQPKMESHLPKALETRRHFDRELKNLEIVNSLNHPHLTPLLAAFEHGDQHCLLFPWADANLQRLFNHTTAGPPLNLESLLWLTKQLRGLADGLRLFHACKPSSDDEFQCVHGHISGYHILGFRDPDRPDYMINATAFTLAWSGFGSGTPSYSYQPPECNAEGYGISASYDVWSFGCLMLEMIAWFLGGGEYVGKFLHSRKKPDILTGGVLSTEFYEYVRDAKDHGEGPVFARVKTAVHDSVDRLRTNSGCSDIIHRILDLVVKRMLIVESDGLRQRASSTEVFYELDSIHRDASRFTLTDVVTTHRQVISTLADREAVEIHLNGAYVQILRQRFDQLEPHHGEFRRSSYIRDSRGPAQENNCEPAMELMKYSEQTAADLTQRPDFKKTMRWAGNSEHNGARRRNVRQSHKQQRKRIPQLPPQPSTGIGQRNRAIALEVLPHLVYLIIILSLLHQPRLLATDHHQNSKCA
ncbi:hypothetical protein QBC44DRAFT_139737 [Cladorrhinum sp. PSN332]|nr:hypothetical protein QBC44DRAFT_139737 [Cladorrhinum sp. PSN332]